MSTSYDKPNQSLKKPISGNLWGRGRLRDRIVILMIIAISPILLVYSYINVTAEQQDLEDVLLERAKAIAITGATYIETSFEQAIENGLLTTEDVFDENYVKYFNIDITKYPEISDDPAIYDKFRTSYDAFADKTWQRFLDSNLTGPEILYAVGSDRNGYVPTHNAIFSTGDGDPGTDRTKRIFSDEVGITASRNTEGILTQIYQQTGTGTTLWDVSMPIYVNGQHWGAFRVGIALAENQIRIQTATTRAVIATSVLLLVVGVFALFLGNYITQPIERLTTAAQKAAAGDLDTVIDIQNRNEISILADSFNQMTSQIREFIQNLEQQVANRTQALTTSSEISRQLSTIREKDKLVSEVVEQLKSGFNYYHAHMYLLSEDKQRLIMAGGTGEAGKILLEREHSLPLGRGLVGRAAESKEAVLVPNTRKSPDWLPNPLLPDTQAEIAVPIIFGGEVLGVLDVQNDIANSLTQQDADLIRAVADQVGIALENIQASAGITKRITELQTVADISIAISSIQDIQEMLETMVHLTQRRFNLYHCHVFLYEKNSDHLAIVACGYKEGDEHQGTHGTTTIPLSQEQSLVARAARTRQPVIVNDVRSDPGWLPNPLLPDTAAELAVPMIVGEQLIGVLDVQAERTNAFTQEDASIQVTLASQVAIAVQNAYSLTQTREQARRETTLNLIGQKIQNTTSIEQALQITARELGQALGKKPTLVSLNSSEKISDQQ